MRTAVVAIGALLLAGALLGLALGSPAPPMLMAAGFGALILVGSLFERRRYKQLAEAPPGGMGWRLTDERFSDPDSGANVAVYHNDRTGERRYVRSA
jgi:hypothetical protein